MLNYQGLLLTCNHRLTNVSEVFSNYVICLHVYITDCTGNRFKIVGIYVSLYFKLHYRNEKKWVNICMLCSMLAVIYR